MLTLKIICADPIEPVASTLTMISCQMFTKKDDSWRSPPYQLRARLRGEINNNELNRRHLWHFRRRPRWYRQCTAGGKDELSSQQSVPSSLAIPRGKMTLGPVSSLAQRWNRSQSALVLPSSVANPRGNMINLNNDSLLHARLRIRGGATRRSFFIF